MWARFAIGLALGAALLGAIACGKDKSFPCGVCQSKQFSCTADSFTGTASISSAGATGCSGTIVAGTDNSPIWLHCDEGTICVEHDTECFAGSATADSFSYVVASKNLTVTCRAKTISPACEPCGNTAFDCVAGGTTLGTASITSADSTTCTGTIGAGADIAPLWLHCDRQQICVEHETECFPVSRTASSFSYTIPDKNSTIVCTAK